MITLTLNFVHGTTFCRSQNNRMEVTMDTPALIEGSVYHSNIVGLVV